MSRSFKNSTCLGPYFMFKDNHEYNICIPFLLCGLHKVSIHQYLLIQYKRRFQWKQYYLPNQFDCLKASRRPLPAHAPNNASNKFVMATFYFKGLLKTIFLSEL